MYFENKNFEELKDKELSFVQKITNPRWIGYYL